MGVEATLSASSHPRKHEVGLSKKQLYQLKTILVNNLVEFEKHPNELQGILDRQKIVYKMNNKINYLTLEFDIEKAKFMVENGKEVFRHARHEEALFKQHQRTLKRNLDLVILSVFYETMTGKTINMEELRKTRRNRDPFMPINPELTNTVEALSTLYRLNKALVTYLRDQLIDSLYPLMGDSKYSANQAMFKELIKNKIGHLIAGLYVKHPDTHQRVVFDQSAHHA